MQRIKESGTFTREKISFKRTKQSFQKNSISFKRDGTQTIRDRTRGYKENNLGTVEVRTSENQSFPNMESAANGDMEILRIENVQA